MIRTGSSRGIQPIRYHDDESVRHVEKRLLIGANETAPNVAMRRFTIGAGGHTPYHAHPWEHEVYVLTGHGEIRFSGGRRRLESEDFAFVPPMEEHQFANVWADPFEFLCVVPLEGET